ncbi:16S rRNA (cytosine(967)-C(5))-methyltransferase RsmB [Curvibacter sp. CHRR-16]|uniref:16S rRNA (cytosine(967)-C(5))-methyltransferase RsmB n=1 Tax=Curvibacter sp. CHRR-16 TaxID=2835872 RepID=UPI001BDAFFA3|nr:16S rRNA (cytosine(967)-C(5))-methyltransferase RsmB [Curvibacter sp. CHRR-16]MBT0571719.1 16S rRNA (cytosine(967)-C(5))-methyltransferase RsmB [Curvibacter sp. CHRR-16]
MHAPALSVQLNVVVNVLLQVRAGTSGREALDGVSADLRPGVQALVFTVWRYWARGQFVLRQLASKQPKPAVRALLEAVLSLLTADDGMPYPAFTLVNQAVLASKQHPHMRGASSFVNACLRNYLRQAEALEDLWRADEEALWNFPRWWIARVRQDHPTQWQQILQASNQQAPLTLRVNARWGTAATYAHQMAKPCRLVAHNGVQLDQAQSVPQLPGYAAGSISVQDAAAQLAAPLLWQASTQSGARPVRVLDACAAPGGKTGHLLELGATSVVALEKDAKRARRIGENLQRLGMQAQVVVADASNPAAWWDGQFFDAILLDAPCSAAGIVRRHPDIRWLRREEDIAALAELQRRILHALWKVLKPSGHLLYATCSLFRQEGEDTIQWFTQAMPDAVRLPAPGHMLPQLPGASGTWNNMDLGAHDGFYYALLAKNAH